jgi:Fic-DOC domain mobile mystery protein B
MTGPLDEPEDATPLSPEERDGLIPSHVEQQNILEADIWALSRRMNPVSEVFGRGLHRRMFGDVRRWAGTYRASNKNLGIDRMIILSRLYEVLDQVRYWIEHETFPPDEIAVRFHHAIVFIHPFPNGTAAGPA